MKTFKGIYLLAILSLLVIFSCIKEPPVTYSYYTIVNESTHNLVIKLYNRNLDTSLRYDSFLILKNDSISFSRSAKESIEYPFPVTDSVFIVFDDFKRLVYKLPFDGSRNILYYESYSGGMIKEYEYRFRYVITEQDYLDAIGK